MTSSSIKSSTPAESLAILPLVVVEKLGRIDRPRFLLTPLAYTLLGEAAGEFPSTDSEISDIL